MTLSEGISAQEISVWLAQGLGQEKAQALVAGGCQKLGYWQKVLAREQVHGLLDLIAQEPGLVGMTAMLAKSRLHFLKASATLNR
jgi:hypothetical protein